MQRALLSKEKILIIQLSAILHDIGKVDVQKEDAAKGAVILEA